MTRGHRYYSEHVESEIALEHIVHKDLSKKDDDDDNSGGVGKKGVGGKLALADPGDVELAGLVPSKAAAGTVVEPPSQWPQVLYICAI